MSSLAHRVVILVFALLLATAVTPIAVADGYGGNALVQAKRGLVQHRFTNLLQSRLRAARSVEWDRDDVSEAIPQKSPRSLSMSASPSDVPVSDPSLDVPNEGDAQTEPSIAAHGDDVLAAWIEGRTQSLGAAYSTDGGHTYTQLGNPLLPPGGGNWTADPVVTVNERTGEFYMCGAFDPSSGNGDEHGVAVARGSFIGGSFHWVAASVVKSLREFEGFIDKPWIVADSSTANLYLTYTRFYGNVDSIVFIRSTDDGVTWGPQLTMSAPSAAGAVQGSRPVVGPGGEVYVTWKEIGPINGDGSDFFRIRKSIDEGVSFGPQQTIASFFDDWGSGAPGFNREQSVAFPSIAVDRTTGPHRGRVYVAWNESLNFYDSPPDLTPVRNEVEPNDDVSTANSFTPGDVLAGTFHVSLEFDYYKFSAVQGTTYIFVCDHSTHEYTMRVFCSDGQTRLAFSGDRFNDPPSIGLIVWTCPSTGTYYLRMAEAGNIAGGSYRVLTGIDIPGGPHQRARDHRDVFVAASDDGFTWADPVLVHPQEPGLYDDWLPEVAVMGDGTVAVLWYDWADAPPSSCGGQSQTYLAKSTDGGSTWQSLGSVTSQGTAWSQVAANIIPNQGDYISLFGDRDRVYACWTDGRLGTPDIWSAPVAVNVPSVTVEFDLDPDHVHLGAAHMGRWMTARIEPPGPYHATDIDPSSLRLNGSVGIDPEAPTAIEDSDENGFPELMVKFERTSVEAILTPGDSVPVTITGQIAGASLIGEDVISVRQGHIRAPRAAETLIAGGTYPIGYTPGAQGTASTVALLHSTDGGATWVTDATGLPNDGTVLWNVPGAPSESVRLAVVEIEQELTAFEDPFDHENGSWVVGVLGMSEPFRITASLGIDDPHPSLELGAVPTPASGKADIRLSIPRDGVIALDVFDASGRHARSIAAGWRSAGRYSFEWRGDTDNGAATPGLYFVRLHAENRELVRRIVWIR